MRLFIYPSNRCNMACRYCMVDLNRGPAVVITSEALRGALEWLMREPSADRRRNITFLGGEPLLHYPLLRRFVEFARGRCAPEALDLAIVTNGYYLDAAKLAFFSEYRVNVSVSLDGAKDSNDRHRVFEGASRRSVFESVMERLGAGRSDIGASMVASPGSAAVLADNVKFLHRQGFRKMGLGLDYFASWGLAALKALARNIKEIRNYAAAPLNGSSLDFFPVRGSLPGLKRRGPLTPTECDVVLGADGYFCVSHAGVGVPYGKNNGLRAGSPQDGLDLKKIQKTLLSPLKAQRREIGRASPQRLSREFFALMREFPGLLPAAHWALLRHGNPVPRVKNMLEAASVVHDYWLL